MAGSVRAYADTVATTLGAPADPEIVELLAAADAIDTALAAPATLDAALTRWRAATDALRDRLLDYLLAEIPVGSLPPLPAGDDWDAPDGVRIEASLGPLQLVVASPPLRLPDPRDATTSWSGPSDASIRTPSGASQSSPAGNGGRLPTGISASR